MVEFQGYREDPDATALDLSLLRRLWPYVRPYRGAFAISLAILLVSFVLEVLGPMEARLTVTEGRYHMVRRMFAAVGNHVEGLHRERVGGLALPDDLAPGQWRLLDPEQIDAIFA